MMQQCYRAVVSAQGYMPVYCTCMEQNFGPHIEQKWAVLAGSLGRVASWKSRAVTGSKDRLNWSHHRNSKRALLSASSQAWACGCPCGRTALVSVQRMGGQKLRDHLCLLSAATLACMQAQQISGAADSVGAPESLSWMSHSTASCCCNVRAQGQGWGHMLHAWKAARFRSADPRHTLARSAACAAIL